jgi:phosphotransferase system enzyme I (PtsP)
VDSAFPDLASQTQLYARILDQAGDRPVVFRTLDVGGDKVLPYVGEFGDDNPAMGWRAIRIGLDRPAMLRQQLRAMVAAAGGRSLSVMFPMIAQVEELVAARHLLELELGRARRQGELVPGRLRVGVMLEVPALLWQLDHLLPRIDFVSIGSNDLVQFLFAADRGNPRLAGRYDCLSPAALRVLDFVVTKSNEAGVEVSVCGEMASRPIEALALLGLGLRTLSMTPSSVGPVKAMLRSVDLRRFSSFLRETMGANTRTLRETIKVYARDHGIAI